MFMLNSANFFSSTSSSTSLTEPLHTQNTHRNLPPRMEIAIMAHPDSARLLRSDSSSTAASSGTGARKSKRKTKTFSGCGTCRSRKVKCDLGRPTCKRCEKSGLECAGYQIQLYWSKPIQFDKYGYQLRNSDDEEKQKGFQRRNIEFVRYRVEYETYEDMDRDLGITHNPVYSKISNNHTYFEGLFGVFEGLIDIPDDLLRKRKKVTKNKYTVLEDDDEEGSRDNKRPRPFADTPESRSMSNISSSKANSPATGQGSRVNTPANNQPSPRNQLMATRAAQGLSGLTERPISPSKHEPSPLNWKTDSLFGDQSRLNQEWLSNELRFDALLSATAATSNDQNNAFFDLLYPYNNQAIEGNGVSNNAVPDIVAISEAFPLDRDVFNALKPHHNFFDQNDPHLSSSNDTDIGTGANSDGFLSKSLTDEIVIDTQESNMPENVMQIINTPVFPKLDPSLNVPTKGLKISSITRFLLDHYYQKVADMMPVVPFAHNPWKTIYFPRAVQALGDLCAMGRSSNSRMSLLNALLAVSCFFLQSKFEKGSTEMKFFLNLGIEFRLQASSFLKKVLTKGDLQTDLKLKKEKYKDVVVAILSMNTIDVVWGTMADCQYYLSLCEKIIKQRMTTRPQLSNKAKILHRVFSFLKLLQDSTNYENLTRINDETKSKFFNRLIESKDNGTTTEFYENVDQDGQIEIGFINKAMFNGEYAPEFIDEDTWKTKSNKEVLLTDALYGLPNSLILLFSEIVKLIKLKLYVEKSGNVNEINKVKELVDSIEKKLLSWKPEWKLKKIGDVFISELHEGLYYHIHSFYNALMIYFYKMVKGINDNFLQSYASACITYLEALQNLSRSKDVKILPMIWQGFIAGCSAIDTDLQNKYRLWASELAKDGIGSYWGARQVMFEVWRRRQNNEAHDNWLNVHRDWEMNIMLS